jgi:transcriptional regulator with XRE-family HTH domain
MEDLGIHGLTNLEKISGFPRDTIRNVMRGRSKNMKPDKAKKLSQVLGITLDELLGKSPLRSFDDIVLVADCFDGSSNVIPFSYVYLMEKFGSVDFKSMTAKGDAMEPLIGSGDLLLIDVSDKILSDGAVYVMRLRGDPFIRRIQTTTNGLVMSQDNQAYSGSVVSTDDVSALDVVGRIIYVGKKI